MPHLTVRGMEEEKLKGYAEDLKSIVVELAQVKPEWVKIFHNPVRRVDAPDEVAVDVYWMHRPQTLCDEVARGITVYMQGKGYDFVQVTFTEFEGPHFYENNVHY